MKQIKFLIAAIVFLSLISLVHASSVAVSVFYDATTKNSFPIYVGDNVGIIVSANSILEKSMTVNVDLLDSSGNLIKNLVNVYTTNYAYSTEHIFGKDVYGAEGNYIIRASVKAASGSTDTADLYLEVLKPICNNNPPKIKSTPITSVNEGQYYSYHVIATDVDNDPLTYSLIQNPAWISIDSNGVVSGTAPLVDSDYEYSITVKVSDGKDFATQFYTLTDKNIVNPNENHLPIALNIDYSTNENIPLAIHLSATDQDNDPLTYIIVSNPSHGVLTGNGAARTYAPSEDFSGKDSFTYKAYDGKAYSNLATATITVKEIIPGENHPPIITSTPITSVN